MEPQDEVLAFLKKNNIPFELRRHEAVHTMEDCARLNLPGPHCKNLFLSNRAGTQFYLLLLPAEKPFVTREVSHALGVSRLSFGRDEDLYRLLRTHPGSVSPMGLIFPESAPVRLLCDRALTRLPTLAFHPLTPEASLWMSTEDFFRSFLPLTGHEVTLLE